VRQITEKQKKKLPKAVLQLMDELHVTADAAGRANINGVVHRLHQVISYYPEDNTQCNELRMGYIECVFSRGRNHVAFIVRKCDPEYLEHYAAFRLHKQLDLELVGDRQLASHAPNNVIEMGYGLGNVIALKATPIVFPN